MKKFERSPAALVVLNLLAERPRHPYALRVLIRERGIEAVVRMGGSSVYDAVARLEKLGLIEVGETSRDGRRPERTVYGITEKGREELHLWMGELLAEPDDEYPRFAAALAFVIGVGRERTQNLLRNRIRRLESLIAAHERSVEELSSVPRIALIEGEYGQAMRVAELEWVRGVIADIAAGRLWSDSEIEVLFSMSSDADQDLNAIPVEVARVLEQRTGRASQQKEEGRQ